MCCVVLYDVVSFPIEYKYFIYVYTLQQNPLNVQGLFAVLGGMCGCYYYLFMFYQGVKMVTLETDVLWNVSVVLERVGIQRDVKVKYKH